jgi:hypothetical protein
MVRTRLSGVARAGLAGLAAIAVLFTAGFVSSPLTPARHGRETFKIVATTPGPRHAPVYATGAFHAKGYFWRKRASLVFPHGRLAVHRNLLSTADNPPDLATCVFTARQTGTFTVFYATGWYKGLRYSGDFTTSITGHLKKTGHDQCGSKIVSYRAVTYEAGVIP